MVKRTFQAELKARSATSPFQVESRNGEVFAGFRNWSSRPFGAGFTAAAILLVRAYRYAVSPFLGPSCRFHPSCSEYAIEALQRYGAWRGGWLALRRLLRCHPWHPGGFDPLP